MELLENLFLGFETALLWENILFCFLGALLGTVVGVLPGIGPTATVALLLPLTFTLDHPVTGIIMLAGIYYGAQYGGSTTAILINLPGESSSAVTAIDGHQMARKGRAGQALAIAALGSFFAGTVATLILAVASPPLASAALNFHAADMFALVVLGLLISISLASGSTLKALGMVVLGVLLSTVGRDMFTYDARFTLDIPEFDRGIDFVPVAVAVFGISEILRNLHEGHERRQIVTKLRDLMPTREDFRRSAGPVLRGTGLGSALGVLPGGGHILSSFASYSMEKRISKTPKRFGRGAIEGVAGPESANNAAAQTSFVPLLSLGLPGHPVMALMAGALIIQGIQPGPNVINSHPVLFWGLIASMWIGNLMLVLLNLPLIGIWVRLLAVPYAVLFPAIIVFASLGSYSLNRRFWDVMIIVIFGALGYVLVRAGCEPAPLLLGFVLGPMLEENLRRALIASRGEAMVFLERPISLTLLLVAAAILLISALPSIRRKREAVFIEDE